MKLPQCHRLLAWICLLTPLACVINPLLLQGQSAAPTSDDIQSALRVLEAAKAAAGPHVEGVAPPSVDNVIKAQRVVDFAMTAYEKQQMAKKFAANGPA